MTLTATVTHTTKEDRWGDTVYHYQINLSNGLIFNRQATGGTKSVVLNFNLSSPRLKTASVNIRRMIREYGNKPGYVIVNLETEEVIICG